MSQEQSQACPAVVKSKRLTEVKYSGGQTQDCNPILCLPCYWLLLSAAFTFTGLLRKLESKIQEILIERQSPTPRIELANT